MKPVTDNLASAEPIGTNRVALEVGEEELVSLATEALSRGMRLALIAAHDDKTRFRAVYLFTGGPPDRRIELHLPMSRDKPSVPSLARQSFPAGRFEREMQDLFGIVPLGHPQPRPLVLHQHWPEDWHPMAHTAGAFPGVTPATTSYPFAPVEGAGVYEIPVGPVHAGLIEPGHFRFWAVGESILRMKARLWFLHKGVEKLFEGCGVEEGLRLAERISGDSAVGHGLAYCLAVEDAQGWEVPSQAQVLRALLLEMERLYNHVSDIGAMCNDVAFGIAHAWALRLREYLLRLNAQVTGHRLLRGGILPGSGIVHRVPDRMELGEIGERFEELVELATRNSMVMERFDGTAVLSTENARDLGVVGVVGRGSGLAFDARRSHPTFEAGEDISVVTQQRGDVMARFQVRVEEVRSSLALIASYAQRADPPGVVPAPRSPLGRDDALTRSSPRILSDVSGASGVGLVEGWRGVIVHRIEIDRGGRLTRAKIVDPSFLNWPALPVALTDTIVPDFPLANKSFNLSYAGNDL